MKKNNKIVLILSIILMTLLFILLIGYGTYKYLQLIIVGTETFNHKEFNIKISEKFNSDSYSGKIFLEYDYKDGKNISIFKDRENDNEIIRVEYDGLSEKMNYKLIDNELLFWVNGTDDYYTTDKQRKNVLSRWFIFEIDKLKIIEKPNNINNDLVIYDINKYENKYYIIGEKAKKIGNFGIWEESSLYIDNSYYDISIPAIKNYRMNSFIEEDRIIVPTPSGVYIFGDELKKVYSYDDATYSYIFKYDDEYIIIFNDEIVKVDGNFNKIKGKKYEHGFNYGDYYFVNNELLVYSIERKCGNIITISLDTLEEKKIIENCQ